MRVISYSDAKSKLNQVIDQVVADVSANVIFRRNADAVVLMSFETYDTMVENMRLTKQHVWPTPDGRY